MHYKYTLCFSSSEFCISQLQFLFNTLRYNRRSCQNLSLTVHPCHSKAIFYLPFPISSQLIYFKNILFVTVSQFIIMLILYIGYLFKSTWKFLCKVSTNILSFSMCLLFSCFFRLAWKFWKVKTERNYP